jgi:hypothetical protein
MADKKINRRFEVTKEQAKKMIAFKEDNTAHVFSNEPFGLIGCDYSKESLFKHIDKAESCRLAGKLASEMGHGLVILPHLPCEQSDALFVETKSKVKKKK